MGTKANDAFIFACLPIIAFYVSLWIRAKGQDKKGIGALLFIFAIAIAFWTIYNQNSTGLTLWAEKHTDRVASPTTARLTGAIFPMQKVTDTLRLVNKQDQYMRDVKDDSGHVIKEMGPDPYFVNVPKDQWPHGKEVKLPTQNCFNLLTLYSLLR